MGEVAAFVVGVVGCVGEGCSDIFIGEADRAADAVGAAGVGVAGRVEFGVGAGFQGAGEWGGGGGGGDEGGEETYTDGVGEIAEGGAEGGTGGVDLGGVFFDEGAVGVGGDEDGRVGGGGGGGWGEGTSPEGGEDGGEVGEEEGEDYLRQREGEVGGWGGEGGPEGEVVEGRVVGGVFEEDASGMVYKAADAEYLDSAEESSYDLKCCLHGRAVVVNKGVEVACKGPVLGVTEQEGDAEASGEDKKEVDEVGSPRDCPDVSFGHWNSLNGRQLGRIERRV